MKQLQTFDYKNVALKEGHWKKQRDELIETYLKIEDDDLLHPFRKLAKLPNKGHGLVGWYGKRSIYIWTEAGRVCKAVSGDRRCPFKGKGDSTGRWLG